MCIQTREDMVLGILSRTNLINCRDDLWDSAARTTCCLWRVSDLKRVQRHGIKVIGNMENFI